MAAAGKNAILHYRSLTAGVRPSALAGGELFLQSADGGIAWPNAAGAPVYTPLDNYLVLPNDYTNATTTASNVFQFPVVANAVYEIDLLGLWQSSSIMVALQLAMTSTASSTQGMRVDISPNSNGTTAPTSLHLKGSGALVTGPTPSAPANYAIMWGGGLVAIGATAGNITLQAAASASGSVTMKAGTLLKYRRVV